MVVEFQYLSNVEAKLLCIDEKENNAFIILKYFDGNFQCFCQWLNGELKYFTNQCYPIKP